MVKPLDLLKYKSYMTHHVSEVCTVHVHLSVWSIQVRVIFLLHSIAFLNKSYPSLSIQI